MLRRSAPVPTRAPSSVRGRAGFTLIELLVVIAIIAALVGLTIAGVMRVLGAGPRAQTSSTLSALANGVNTFASERQVPYIPAGHYDPSTNRWTGPFRLQNSYPDTNWPEAQYIARVFGRVNFSDLGYRPGGSDPVMPAQLDANQTLLFFVNGIQSHDGQGNVAFRGFQKGQQPFAPFTQGENRLGPYFGEITARQYVASGREFARIIDGWRTPIAYFTAYNAKPAVVNSGAYGGVNTAPGLVGPYFTGTGYANPSGFQLISAGENKRFGAGGNWANVSLDGADDRANFSPNNLGAGPQ
jgi:prepilin-type N-terminal cleavage/methylation domain-containing protein